MATPSPQAQGTASITPTSPRKDFKVMINKLADFVGASKPVELTATVLVSEALISRDPSAGDMSKYGVEAAWKHAGPEYESDFWVHFPVGASIDDTRRGENIEEGYYTLGRAFFSSRTRSRNSLPYMGMMGWVLIKVTLMRLVDDGTDDDRESSKWRGVCESDPEAVRFQIPRQAEGPSE